MNYAEALSFTFEDKEWVKKMAIGGFIALISFYAGLLFLFGFFLIGYYIAILKEVSKNSENPLPDWADFTKILVDGILGSIIIFVYFVIIGGVCAIIIVYLSTSPGLAEAEMVLGIVFTSLFTLFALITFSNIALLLYSNTDNFGAAFNFTEVLKFFRQQAGNLFAISLFTFILNLILLCAGLGVFSPFTNFWGFVVQAHLFGQCNRNYHAAEPVVESAEFIEST